MTPRPPRALWLFSLVALGLVLARWAPEIAWIVPLAGAALCALVALVVPKRVAWTLLTLSAVGGSWAWASVRWYEPPVNALAQRLDILAHERRLVTVAGVLLERPRILPAERGALGSFARFEDDPLRTRLRLEGPLSGVVRLRIQASVIGARAGDRVRVTGWYTPDRPPSNPGERDFSRYGAERVSAGSISVPRAELVERLSGPSGLRARAAAFIERLRDAGAGALPDDDSNTSALLRALVLGERGPAYRELSEPFTRSGLAHVLAISGMHLGVLAGLGMLLVRITGDRPRTEALVVIALVLLVLLLVPARAPIVRAGVIAIALTCGGLAGRRYHPIVLLAWAGVFVLAWRPSELFSPGFQLSFGVVAALVSLAPIVERRWFGPLTDPDTRTGGQRAMIWLRRAMAASFVAWIVSLALVAHAFGVVAWLSPLSAILAVPVAGLVLGLGYGAVILELVIPGSSSGVGQALLLACEPLLVLVRAIDAVPYAHTDVPRLSAWWAAGATALAVWWCVRGSGSGRLGRALMLASLLGVGAWTFTELRATGLDHGVALRVDALSLGDGSCYLIRSGDEAMLFDCGSSWTGAGVRSIPEAARALGMPTVDRAVVSHPDIDHYACLPDAAEALGVRTLLIGDRFFAEAREHRNGPAAALLAETDALGVTSRVIGAGASWTLGDARVEVLAPSLAAMFEHDNDHALVLRISVETDTGVRTLLLVGDLEDDGITALRRAHPDLRADVVEAPHHGSAREVAAAFVASLEPTLVIQSTGPSRLDHPVWAHVREQSAWWTTATQGAVGVEIKSDGSIEHASTAGM